MYRMMLGDFDHYGFSAKSKAVTVVVKILFVAFTFLVMLILLNMLIAIISDSYDYAIIRAEELFLQARINLAAELVAIGVAKSNAEETYAWIPSLRWFEFVFRFRKQDKDAEDTDG